MSQEIFSEELEERTDGVEYTEPRAKEGNRYKDSMTELTSYQEDQFAALYIKHRFNGTAAMLEADPKLKTSSAQTIASMHLSKPSVRRKIVSLIPQDDLEEQSLIKKAFAAQLPDKISFKELHSFVRTSLELKNKIGRDKTNTDVKIGLVINNQ